MIVPFWTGVGSSKNNGFFTSMSPVFHSKWRIWAKSPVRKSNVVTTDYGWCGKFHTYRCKSRAFINRIITLLIFVIGLNIWAILFIMLILHSDDLLFLMLIVIHLSTLCQTPITGWWWIILVWAYHETENRYVYRFSSMNGAARQNVLTTVTHKQPFDNRYQCYPNKRRIFGVTVCMCEATRKVLFPFTSKMRN